MASSSTVIGFEVGYSIPMAQSHVRMSFRCKEMPLSSSSSKRSLEALNFRKLGGNGLERNFYITRCGKGSDFGERTSYEGGLELKTGFARRVCSRLAFDNPRLLEAMENCIQQVPKEANEIKNESMKPGNGSSDVIAKHDTSVWTSSVPEQNSFPPLVNALKSAAKQDVASFHFPGHNRGLAAPTSLAHVIGISPFHHDLPELPELDNLFSPEGPILDAQKLAAELFGASNTWFLVGGSTCGIQASVMATCSPGDTLILPRNSHLSATSAMVLSGVIPKYIFPEYNADWDIAGGINAGQVRRALDELTREGRKAAAILVTSPTYQGICSNIIELSSLSHSYGIPLIVDEAHGAHLGFHSDVPSSALQQGADIAVQSTHKVLCSLTQSSMLHVLGAIVDRDRVHKCLQTLQSSSPSNLLLASLDAARAQLSEMPGTIFDKAINLSEMAKELIKEIPGVSVLDISSFPSCCAMDPLRLTVGFWQLGLSGYEADDFLHGGHGIVCELVGSRSITFAVSLGTRTEHIERLVSGIECLREVLTGKKIQDRVNDAIFVPFSEITTSLSPREAFFARKRTVKLKESIGKVSGEMICPYPPGIPVITPGEMVSERAVDYLLQARREGALITGASDSTLATITVCIE